MQLSFKFRHFLSLSVLNEVLHRFHFRVKLRSKKWKKYGITIYKIYHWRFGKFWLSYSALFSGKTDCVEYQKALVGYAQIFQDLDYELFFILWKYGNFIDFLEDMYGEDFVQDDIPDLDLDDSQIEVDRLMFQKHYYSELDLEDLDGDDDIIF